MMGIIVFKEWSSINLIKPTSILLELFKRTCNVCASPNASPQGPYTVPEEVVNSTAGVISICVQ